MSLNQKNILSLLMTISLFNLPCYSSDKLSSRDEEKLLQLKSSSTPQTLIFGKLDEPLKANISIYEIKPNVINIQNDLEKVEVKKTTDSALQPISLGKEKEETKDIQDLTEKRKQLQKEEIVGLNFIQPSIGLTEEEQSAIDEFFTRNEQEQLLNLWKSAIERNKTIQFIVQKLTPAKSTQEGNSALSKTIGAAVFLPFYAIQAISNNQGAFYGSQLGGRVLGSIVDGKMQKNQAQLQLSQTETIVLFMMIDEVAERLRTRYHEYKKLMVDRALASNELEEAKKDSLDARDTKSVEAQFLTSIQRRSIEREIRKIDSSIRAQRNALIELSGMDAVNDLDNQLKLELAATTNTPLDFIGVRR